MIGKETRERILRVCKVHGSDSDINIAAFHLLCNQLIELGKAEGRAETRKFMVQIFTDPENQPSQYGTVTLEYMQREIEAEREACAKMCEEKQQYAMPIPCPDGIDGCLVMHSVPAYREKTGQECAAAIRARGEK